MRAFRGFGGSGYHFLARREPIPPLRARDLALALPPAAAADLVEWGPACTAEGQFQAVLAAEVPLSSLAALAPEVPPLSDDRPINEYFFLRRYVARQW